MHSDGFCCRNGNSLPYVANPTKLVLSAFAEMSDDIFHYLPRRRIMYIVDNSDIKSCGQSLQNLVADLEKLLSFAINVCYLLAGVSSAMSAILIMLFLFQTHALLLIRFGAIYYFYNLQNQ